MELGRLQRVATRQVWADEAGEFTPWLAEPQNLELLGATIGIEFELEAQEKSVGPFRADILCKDVATDEWVLIENQLERTDHRHLGQLMTYAAGLQAVKIVWIAQPFTEEHRATLDWLNQITDSRFNFFGLEVETWRIGNSAIAPKFNLVSKPNEWSKQVAEDTGRVDLTPTKELQLAFWHHFREHASEHAALISPTKPLPQHWMNLAIGRSGFGLAAIASFWNTEKETYDEHEVRAELLISAKGAESCFEQLRSEAAKIESELGFPVVWHAPEDKHMKKLYIRRDADLEDKATWPELSAWLVAHLDQMTRVLADRIRGMSAEPMPDSNEAAHVE